MEVKGRNLAEGIPRSFTVSSNEILEALTDPLNSIVSAVKSALERTPPELSADICDRGIVLSGGGALLQNLDERLRQNMAEYARFRPSDPAAIRGAWRSTRRTGGPATSETARRPRRRRRRPWPRLTGRHRCLRGDP